MHIVKDIKYGHRWRKHVGDVLRPEKCWKCLSCGSVVYDDDPDPGMPVVRIVDGYAVELTCEQVTVMSVMGA